MIDIWSDEFREAVERAQDDCAPDPADFALPGYEAPGWRCLVENVIEHLAEALDIDPDALDLDEVEDALEEFFELEDNLNPSGLPQARYVPLSNFVG